MRYQEKVLDQDEIAATVAEARRGGRRIVFTNGCFDLLHLGHVRYLAAARDAGDVLVVGINADASVARLKGAGRPFLPAAARAEMVAALAAVDYVAIFEEDTPAALIRRLQPDVLVKGGDWTPEEVVGREVVETRGGRVMIVPLTEGFSTTELAKRIRKDD